MRRALLIEQLALVSLLFLIGLSAALYEHHIDAKLRATQVSSCQRGNVIRNEMNIRAAAVRVLAANQGGPEWKALSVAYTTIPLADCR